jgi:signal transduction histidine kinase/CheY-like chemotaxis protein
VSVASRHSSFMSRFTRAATPTRRGSSAAASPEETETLREYLRATRDMTGYGVYTWDVVNDRFTADSDIERIIGVSLDGGRRGSGLTGYLSVVHPEDRQRIQDALAATLARGGPDYRSEHRVLIPDGDGQAERWISVFGRAHFDADGKPTRLVGVLADITPRRREEEARLRLQKLETLGTLAGGIAHDFNNVVGAILSYARLASMDVEAGRSPAGSIAEIERGAQRGADIVRRLMTFSREEPLQRIPFELSDVVDEAVALMKPRLIEAGVELRQGVAPGLPPTCGDPGQFHRVAINLISNAIQALDEKPRCVDLLIDEVELGELRPGITDSLAPGAYLRFQVIDNGPGITEAALYRIFDPFFTTKPSGSGTGLGLTAAQSIVRSHGGAIAADNRLGGGAVFTVYMPVARSVQRPAESEEQERTDQPRTRSVAARVLFVDDDEALVRLATRMMPQCGCAVAAFTDPVDAFAAFEADPDAFDAVISDFSMPRLGGLQLTEQIRALRPDLPIVLTSGYLDSRDYDNANARGVTSIYPKPYSINELADEVLRLLEPGA